MKTIFSSKRDFNGKIYIAQINNIVGDLSGNFKKISEQYKNAVNSGADLLILQEMVVSGYPCGDWWLRDDFNKKIKEYNEKIIALTKNGNCAIIFGTIVDNPHKIRGYHTRHKGNICNGAIYARSGKIENVILKKSLPNYALFDELRYFQEGNLLNITKIDKYKTSILICEDLWDEKNAFFLKEHDLDFLIVINGSPFEICKQNERIDIARQYCDELNIPLIYVNQVGAQDGIVFDGNSFVMNDIGKVIINLKDFEEDGALFNIEDMISNIHEAKVDKKIVKIDCDIKLSNEVIFPKNFKVEDDLNKSIDNYLNCSIEEIYNASILGVRDYFYKLGFKKAIIGMSGGIDSALVATILCDAIGSKNVTLYALPSKYSSSASFSDAEECAFNLGVELKTISIESVFEVLSNVLDKELSESKEQDDRCKENLQARIRGIFLMSMANKTGNLLMATSNKSETAVGYATIYGDMCGAYSVINDLYKTQIYALSNWRNKNVPKLSMLKKQYLIPENIIKKAPSAELRPNQKDSDSLPEYDILDKILYLMIEQNLSNEAIILKDFDKNLVDKISKMLVTAEFKRQQAAIGTKISSNSFGKDWRYPIMNKYFN